MESVDYKDEKNREEAAAKTVVHSKAIRAGKRTYFFDVKSTRNGENFLTITESKRKYDEDGKFFYEKHKVFLYPEDFEKFASTMQEMIEFIEKNNAEIQAKGMKAESEVSSPVKENVEKNDSGHQKNTDLVEDKSGNEASQGLRFEDI